MKYIITKRTECETCHGHGTVPTPNVPRPIGECPDCKGLCYIDNLVDFDEVLLSRLAKLRFALVTVTGDYENERQSLWDLQFKD